jgi:MFS family permease
MPLNIATDLNTATKRLLLARAIRSTGQGALVVSFTLYLKALGWHAREIGLLLSAAGLAGAGMSVLVGVVSDRVGRKPFLLIYETVIVAMGAAATVSRQPALLAVAAIIAGFGRGQSGAAGPFAPAEGAWLAEAVEPKARGMLYSINTSLGFYGMALGAGIAGLTPLWAHWLPGTLRFRPLFALTALTALMNFLLLRATPGGGRPAPHPPEKAEQRRITEKSENRTLRLLALTNAFNGLAIGLTGPLVPYWFALKFGVGVATIGPVFALTFVLTGSASLVTGALTRRMGIVRSVVVSRSAGLALLALLPILPTYALASGAFALRSAFNRGTVGARQALAVGLVSDSRRGMAASLNAVSSQLPSAIGPTIAGLFFQAGDLTVPFYIAVAFQLVYLGLYGKIFRAYEP